MRANVLNRNMAKAGTTSREPKKETPVHSVTITRKTLSTQQRDSGTEEDRESLAISTSTFSSARSLNYPEVSTSPTASTPTTPKLLGATFGRSGTIHSVTSTSENHNQPSEISHTEPPARTVPARRIVVNSTTSAADTPAAARPKSIAASVKSTSSTIRRGGTSPITPVTPSTSTSTNNGNSTIKAKPEPRKSMTASSLTAPSAAGKATPRSSRASSLSRPSSRVSDVSGSFKSAKSELEVPPIPRNRTLSMASTTSARSVATDSGSTQAGRTRGNLTVSTPKALRPRKTSDASVISTASLSNPRGNVTPKRPSSQASVRSTVSSKAGTTPRRVTTAKTAEKSTEPIKRVPRVSTTSARSLKQSTSPTSAPPKTPKSEPKVVDEPPIPVTPPVIVQVEEHEVSPPTPPPPPVPEKETRRDTIESVGGGLAPTSQKDKRPSASSTMSTTSSSTIRLTKKRSNDTITELSEKDVSTLRANALAKLTGTPSKGSPSRPSAADVVAPVPVSPSPIPVSPTPSRPAHNEKIDFTASPVTPPTAVPINTIPSSFFAPEHSNPQGITLNVGIPCIITSRRARFRAFARYLGEIIGERGPWIGVEVPLGEFAANDKLEGRDWHDGSWNGIRYFDIQNAGWDDDEKAKRRRMGPYGFGRKKETESSLSVDQRSYRLRSASPAVSDVSTYESRGLFVRPQQVLYVIDARAEY
ncbi:hypothetical protein FRC17_002280 [Serendipita sp. 399]|nr:hypothetical protein FRC17_002280 [Serendipita sp. 399]